MNENNTPQENSPPPKAIDPPQKTTAQKGCGGCLGILVVLFFLGTILDKIGPSVSIKGDSGTMKYEILSEYSADLAGWNLAREIYKAATKHDHLKRLDVELELMVPGGVVDRYGNTVQGPLIMGTIVEDDLQEIRRYRDADTYALRNKRVYGLQLLSMEYAYLLSE